MWRCKEKRKEESWRWTGEIGHKRHYVRNHGSIELVERALVRLCIMRFCSHLWGSR
ncbi:hypothetical protein AAZX31_17G084000 [Glycine max]